VSYLIEAFWLWVVTAGVVAVASLIHYVIASARVSELHARLQAQQQKQQPPNNRAALPT